MDDLFELRRLEKWFLKYNTSSIDYSYKSSVISSYNPELLSSVHKVQRQFNYKGIDTDFSAKDYMYSKFGFFSVLESYRINNAYNHRINRLRRRVYDIVKRPDCVFITFTFNDKSLTYKPIVRRNYITRFLKLHLSDYVANIDFGELNGREHYHAVGNLKHLLKAPDWKYGSINFERVCRRDKTDLLLSKYVSKLSNHAIKQSTKRSSLIYPKHTRPPHINNK